MGANAKRITSISNPMVREAAALARRKSSSASGAFLVEGANLLEAALSGHHGKIERLFYTDGFAAKHAALIRDVKRILPPQELISVSDAVINRLSTTESPQGAVAVASCDALPLAGFGTGSPLVILDGVSDPGNLGTIIRTSDAAGAAAVILAGDSCDPFNPKALRASAGSVFNLPVVEAGTDEIVAFLAGNGVKLYAAVAHDGQDIFDAALEEPLALAFGSEAHGLSECLLKAAHRRITLPMSGHAESLNVSAAAAVILFECARRRRAGMKGRT